MSGQEIHDSERVVSESQVPPSPPSPPATPSYSSFSPPPGYVLVPQDMYDLMKARLSSPVQDVTPPSPTSRKLTQAPLINLQVLRPCQLGDIRTQINPGETISWIPNKSITIRGRVHDKLDSFLTAWNQQTPGNPYYNPKFDKLFKINDDSIDDAIAFLSIPDPRLRTPVSDAQRIRREEQGGYSLRRHAAVDGVTMGDEEDDLPPRGSEDRKRLMVEACLNRRDRYDTGEVQEDTSPQVNNSQIRVNSVGSVARIPGPPADETPANPRRRLQRR
jgi:hypothetical protein